MLSLIAEDHKLRVVMLLFVTYNGVICVTL